MFSHRPSSFQRFIAGMALCVSAALAISADHTVAAGATKQPTTMRAAAVVNDIIISTYDLDQRVKLVMVTSGSQQQGAEVEKRLRPQVLRQLIDELLQLQEAQKYNTGVRRFPASIVAGMSGFKQKAYFKGAAGSQQAPNVDFNFGTTATQ